MIETIVLDGRRMQTKPELHRYLKEALHLPGYYGNNLDALMDCLTENSSQRRIEIEFAEAIVESLGKYGENVLRVFRDAAEVNKALEVCIKNRN